jgi:hypothetical protein
MLLTDGIGNYRIELFSFCVREYTMWKWSQIKVLNCNLLFFTKRIFSVNNKVKFLPNGHYIWPIRTKRGSAQHLLM